MSSPHPPDGRVNVTLVILRLREHNRSGRSLGMEARFLSFSVRCLFTVLRYSGFQIELTKLRRNKDKTLSANLAVRTCCNTDRHTEKYLYLSANCYDCATSVETKPPVARSKQPELEADQSSSFKTTIRSVWILGLVS